MLVEFLIKILSMLPLRTEEAFYNISIYLYNKNVLEYAPIARSGPKSMIRNIEGSSINYSIFLTFIKFLI